MTRYIHELPDWPRFRWDQEKVAGTLAAVRFRQGRFTGRMAALGFPLQSEAILQTLTEDVVKSSEIEGEILDKQQVRSSIARRLGMDNAGLLPADRNVEGVVEMMLDATQKFGEPLTVARLFAWHSSLFPTGRSGMTKIAVGAWRNDKGGPMQVISGPAGNETVHFSAPPASRLDDDMAEFLTWFEDKSDTDPVVKAGIAHLWFVTVHPFDDGNGRIARAIADMALARSEDSARRFYSMSSRIRHERRDYYTMLETTQKGSLDVTQWLDWFLNCLDRAIEGAEGTLANVLRKAQFWENPRAVGLNERQRKIITRLLDGFDGKLTSSKWAAIAKTSQDTASRDIADLIDRGLLKKDAAGGRSTSYSLTE
jgi:Fic family protein